MNNIKLLASAGSLMLMTTINAQAAQVIVNDLVVQGSTCTGIDCPSSPSFGFDTLRLSENNLRIHFDDTSNSASFPNVDWRLVANDSTNGGLNRFSIEDATNGKTPFTVEANAPNHSLYVDDGGRIGLGTSSPIVEAHIVDGDTPTLRLEQDGSSGFASQTWDMAGNETNFFIRDVSNGSKLPFKVKPGAPDNALVIDANGQIGMGTLTPDDNMHISSSSPARLKLTNTGIVNSATLDRDWTINSNGTLRISAGTDSAEWSLNADAQMGIGTANPQDDLHIVDYGPARIKLTNSSKSSSATEDPDWVINSNGTLRISAGADTAEMTLSADGNLVVTGGYFVNATQLSVPDYVFEPTYQLKTIDEQTEYMFNNKHLPSVKAAPDPDAQLNLVDQQLGMLEELEKAHIYISLLHNRIKSLEHENSQMVASMDARLQKLEDNSDMTN